MKEHEDFLEFLCADWSALTDAELYEGLASGSSATSTEDLEGVLSDLRRLQRGATRALVKSGPRILQKAIAGAKAGAPLGVKGMIVGATIGAGLGAMGPAGARPELAPASKARASGGRGALNQPIVIGDQTITLGSLIGLISKLSEVGTQAPTKPVSAAAAIESCELEACESEGLAGDDDLLHFMHAELR